MEESEKNTVKESDFDLSDLILCKKIALLTFTSFPSDNLEEWNDELDTIIHNKNTNYFNYDSDDYLIYDDFEAEQELDDYIENYFEEYISPQLPKDLIGYFDYNKWSRDFKLNGRGYILSNYNTSEEEGTMINNCYYFIYKTNTNEYTK